MLNLFHVQNIVNVLVQIFFFRSSVKINLNELTDVMIVTDQFLVLFISYYAILNFWYQLLFSAEGKIQNFVFL